MSRNDLFNHRAEQYRKSEKVGKPTVPWACKSYEDCKNENLLPLIRSHVRDKLGQEKGAEYAKYLISEFNFPRSFFDDMGIKVNFMR